ncbi:GspH/FimT family protein [Catenovulum sediminis]|uniref:Type II secretion system protein H n=1 Tax=Catenovulum sediminis TaxID=1740262 RepID=A0ABV1RNA4_9ALTE
MLYKQDAFTLLELIILLAISLISLTLGIPSLKETLVESRVNNHLYQLNQDILLSRNHAVQFNFPVVMCPLNTNGDCINNWKQGYSIFVDRDNNIKFDQQIDTQVRLRNPIQNHDKFEFSGGRYLRFGENGHIKGLAGTFRYCPHVDDNELYSRAVIISLGGRPRLSRDIDNDGKDETNTNSSHIVCN